MNVKTILLLGFSLFALFAVNTVLSVLLPAIQDEFSLSSIATGAIIASFGWSITLMQVPAGILTDALDPRKMLVASMLGLFLTAVWFSVSSGLLSLDLSRYMAGVSSSFVYLAGMKYIEQKYSPRDRGTALGAFTAMAGVGGGVIPLVASLLLQGYGLGWRLTNVSVGCLALAAALATLLLPRTKTVPVHRSQSHTPSTFSMARMGRDLNYWLHNIISFAYFGTYFGVIFWTPIFLTGQGYGLAYSGIAVALMNAGSIPGNIVAGWLADRVGRRNPVMRGFMVIDCLMILLILLEPYNDVAKLLFLPVSFVFGFTFGGLTPQTRLVVELFPEELIGTAFGITNMMRWLGFAAYPFAVGVLLAMGYPFVDSFLVMLASMVVVTLLSLASRETGERPLYATSSEVARPGKAQD